MYRWVLGENHPDILTSMDNLTATLRDLGDFQGAHELQEQILAARRRVLGVDDSEPAMADLPAAFTSH